VVVVYNSVDDSLNLETFSSVDDSVDGIEVSAVSFVLCVTGHIVVSSGIETGCDSSESVVDTLTVDVEAAAVVDGVVGSTVQKFVSCAVLCAYD